MALAVSLIAVLPTAGCYQGAGNTVNTQGPTGNGTDFLVGGDIKVQDATLVTGPEGQSGVASLVMTLINEGELPDALVKVSTEPPTTSSQRSPIPITPGAAVKVGGPGSTDQVVLTGLKVTPGSYATVTVSFERSGSETRRVAVVPAVGYYEGYGPAAALTK
jgi:hypothetical protein